MEERGCEKQQDEEKVDMVGATVRMQDRGWWRALAPSGCLSACGVEVLGASRLDPPPRLPCLPSHHQVKGPAFGITKKDPFISKIVYRYSLCIEYLPFITGL